MLERFRKPKPEQDVTTGYPDVKFFGFGNERFPFIVGIDIEGYQKFLQNQLKIDPTDISNISLRFLGYPVTEQRDEVNKDIDGLGQTLNRKSLVSVVSVTNELMQIEHMTGVSFDKLDFEQMKNLVLQILAAKLAMESVTIKREIVHKKLHRKPTNIVNGVLKEPLTYVGGFAAGEYLLSDIPWSVRSYILLTSFFASKYASMKVASRLVDMHDNLDEELSSQLTGTMTDPNGDMMPGVHKQWMNLFTIYPMNSGNPK